MYVLGSEMTQPTVEEAIAIINLMEIEVSMTCFTCRYQTIRAFRRGCMADHPCNNWINGEYPSWEISPETAINTVFNLDKL